jgi:hypothetical protein
MRLPQVTSYAEVPTAGVYQSDLDLRHAGAVRTASSSSTARRRAPAAARPTPSNTSSPSSALRRGTASHTHG